MSPYQDDFVRRRQAEIRGYSQPIAPFPILHGHGRPTPIAVLVLGMLIIIAAMFLLAL
jgi:hypothetical protein